MKGILEVRVFFKFEYGLFVFFFIRFGFILGSWGFGFKVGVMGVRLSFFVFMF